MYVSSEAQGAQYLAYRSNIANTTVVVASSLNGTHGEATNEDDHDVQCYLCNNTLYEPAGNQQPKHPQDVFHFRCDRLHDEYMCTACACNMYVTACVAGAHRLNEIRCGHCRRLSGVNPGCFIKLYGTVDAPVDAIVGRLRQYSNLLVEDGRRRPAHIENGARGRVNNLVNSLIEALTDNNNRVLTRIMHPRAVPPPPPPNRPRFVRPALDNRNPPPVNNPVVNIPPPIVNNDNNVDADNIRAPVAPHVNVINNDDDSVESDDGSVHEDDIRIVGDNVRGVVHNPLAQQVNYR